MLGSPMHARSPHGPTHARTRRPRGWLLAIAVAAACGGAEPAPTPPPPVPAGAAAEPSPPPTVATAEVSALATRLLAAGGTTATADRTAALQQVDATVQAILQHGATADPATQGRVPAALIALGTPALPGLAKGLGDADAVQRRLAALTLLQLGDTLHREGTANAVLEALVAARSDSDLRVRAAAEFAWRRATGDTSALDAARAAHEAAERAQRR
jgi:hypothetical protein